MLDFAGDPSDLQATASDGGAGTAAPETAGAKSDAVPAGISGYLEPATEPTQAGPEGIRYDFNAGARIMLPARQSGRWLVRIRDMDTGNTLFETYSDGGFVRSAKQFFVRLGLEVWDHPEQGKPFPILAHEYDAHERQVLIQFPVGTLGDSLAWFPYAARFWQMHGCRLTCVISPSVIPLLQPAYPHIRLITPEQAKAENITQNVYASYSVGLFFDDEACVHQPTDFRHVGLHRTAGYILGVDPSEEPVKLALTDASRPIAEPYVCIAVQSSTQCKYWNNPSGWHGVIEFLKSRGFRVVCIDQKRVHGTGLIWNHIPHGAEDQTGDRPLTERARWLRHASAFIGLSSGLSWLAWAAGTPVVMISGFTHPSNEFHTPYRVINWHTCNSCWNDPRHRFNHNDFMWCPRNAGTDRQFECTRLVTVEHVIGVLKRVPTLSPQTQVH